MGLDICDLISEIQKRPILYDYTNTQYHNRELRQSLWAEVCCNLRTAEVWDSMSKKEKTKYEEKIQKRWSSLRSCFTRELRWSKKEIDENQEKKKKKYLYFDHLLFLLPFTRSSGIEASGNDTCFETDQTSDKSYNSEEDTELDGADKQGDYEEPMISVPSLIKTEVLDNESYTNTEYLDMSDDDHSVNQAVTEFTHSSTLHTKRSAESVDVHRLRTKKCRCALESKVVCKFNDLDDDEAFLASLLPTIKEFKSNEKLQLRIELLTTIVNFKNSINSRSSTKDT